jgi:ribosome recycling factor
MSYDFKSLEKEFEKGLDHVQRELALLRTGKATPQLLDSVQVEAYGSRMRVNELATITAPDPTLLVVTPWDKSVLAAIERAIIIAQLNLNPVIDGDKIRIPVPSLTEDRRKEMVKILRSKIEDGRKMFRTIRGDAKRAIEDLKNDSGFSEDDILLYLEQLEDLMKKYLTELDSIAEKKEAELMKV